MRKPRTHWRASPCACPPPPACHQARKPPVRSWPSRPARWLAWPWWTGCLSSWTRKWRWGGRARLRFACARALPLSPTAWLYPAAGLHCVQHLHRATGRAVLARAGHMDRKGWGARGSRAAVWHRAGLSGIHPRGGARGPQLHAGTATVGASAPSLPCTLAASELHTTRLVACHAPSRWRQACSSAQADSHIAAAAC